MSHGKSTLGPWEAVKVKEGMFYIFPETRTESILPIAVLDHSRDGHEPFRLHTVPFYAALIAAAPELLEALKASLEWVDAVPKETALPAMPGFDRDWVNGIIATAEGK